MGTYTGSRLEASGTVTNSTRRIVTRALQKPVRTEARGKLIMEVEMYIPYDVTDIKGNKQRVSEVVAKLVNKLKEGPLKYCKTDQEWLDGAIKFLISDEGKAWTRSWFQPQIAVNGSVSISPTVASGKASTIAAGKAKMMTNVHLHGNTQLEHQGVQLHEAPADTIRLRSSHMGDSSTMAPAGTTPRPMVSRGNAPGSVSSHRPTAAPGPSSVKMASATATKLSSLTKEVASASSQLLPRTNQHQRSHSDPGQVSLCLQCYTIHGMSYGGPFPTVSSSSNPVSTTGGMQVQRNARNERWAVYIVRQFPFNMMVWALFIVFLVQLSWGYPRN